MTDWLSMDIVELGHQRKLNIDNLKPSKIDILMEGLTGTSMLSNSRLKQSSNRSERIFNGSRLYAAMILKCAVIEFYSRVNA